MAYESYVGVDGESREISYVKVGASGVRHVIAAYAGVDGEVRLIPGLCKIDHIEGRLSGLAVYDYSSGNAVSFTSELKENTDFLGYSNSKSEAIFIYSSDGSTFYGSIEVRKEGGNIYANACDTVKIVATYEFYAVYPDGCEISLKNLYSKGDICGFFGGHMSVGGSVSYGEWALSALSSGTSIFSWHELDDYDEYNVSGGVGFSIDLGSEGGLVHTVAWTSDTASSYTFGAYSNIEISGAYTLALGNSVFHDESIDVTLTLQ
ncbi:MAG: hypothetical protein LUD69_08005 [Oscillospiraceae bacterium]|nr:hypothetical protein [Oscillospiraceae bacterium]